MKRWIANFIYWSWKVFVVAAFIAVGSVLVVAAIRDVKQNGWSGPKHLAEASLAILAFSFLAMLICEWVERNRK